MTSVTNRTNNKEIVKTIGNIVSHGVAKALGLS
jgi:hypothetical protein